MVVEAALGATALLAFAGWTYTLVALMRHLLPMANAVGVLQKVDALVDDRITRVVTRIREKESEKPNVPPGKPQPAPRDATQDAFRSIFGTNAIVEPLLDQPDADDVEVMN